MQWPLYSLLMGKVNNMGSLFYSLTCGYLLMLLIKRSEIFSLCLPKAHKFYQTQKHLLSKLGYAPLFCWSNVAIISGLKPFRDNNRYCQSKLENTHAFKEKTEWGITATCVARIYYGLPSSYTKASKLFKMQQPTELIKGTGMCGSLGLSNLCLFSIGRMTHWI